MRGVGWERVEEIATLAREYTKPAFMKIVELMRDADANKTVQLAAATFIIDRGWGKAPQQIEAKIDIYAKMSDDELKALVLKEVEILALEASRDAEELQEKLLDEAAEEPEKPEGA